MVAHDVYHAVDLSGLQEQVARPILIDGRSVFSAAQARTAGWDCRGVGLGSNRTPTEMAIDDVGDVTAKPLQRGDMFSTDAFVVQNRDG